VSSTKFAAITANLLARKGEAAPSVVVPVIALARPTLVARGDRPVASEPTPLEKVEKLRRIVISITQEELERLCIAAIKTGSNRHDIVRSALNDYFRKLSAEFPHPCACMEDDAAVAARHTQSEVRAAPRSYPACAENLDAEIMVMKTSEDQVPI
jgi:hypothetical protein